MAADKDLALLSKHVYETNPADPSGEEARASALGWHRFADAFAAAGTAGARSFTQFPGLGVANGLPRLESFKGLNEGLTTL